eukprot:CAMPEP_0114461136 /NCGR_PEP_ID=MMETSP0104-20121206/6116_1 /TAXON_ID=37642 ORGANISM="Paraphysomonas imperforata, Strain PA2" /NCGR_SAMPLE_ID=MMETSP0104 /ASSEMBLY_ACC=CAM_ASM_000202 /LENGTH=675 /DNA_ID=CAMNT_0001633891 /DNA_START=42 /DNA_END=2066 /DNA_ORIENTATION=+
MANKSLRCIRAEGSFSTKNKKTTSEILATMGQYDLMDLLRAKRGGELNQIINNQSHLSLENSENAFEMDGVNEGKSPSLLSSIESREDLDFHDEVFVNRSDGSSTSSSYKSLKLRMMDSNSSEALVSPPGVLSSSSDQIFTPRESSDSSLSFPKGPERQSSSTVNDDRSPEGSVNGLPSPRGVSVGGGQAKITKANVSSARTGNSNEAQSFFSRAFTGIRSGSQGNILSSGGSGGAGGGGWGNGGTNSSTPNKEPDSDEKQLDFFSRALTGIRPSPQRNPDDEKKMKALRLENKLKQMDQKSRKFDNRLKDLERTAGRGDGRSKDAKKQLDVPTPPSTRLARSKSQNDDSRTTAATSSSGKPTSTAVVQARDDDSTTRKSKASGSISSRQGVGEANAKDNNKYSPTPTSNSTISDKKKIESSNSDALDHSNDESGGRGDSDPSRDRSDSLPIKRFSLRNQVEEPKNSAKDDSAERYDDITEINVVAELGSSGQLDPTAEKVSGDSNNCGMVEELLEDEVEKYEVLDATDKGTHDEVELSEYIEKEEVMHEKEEVVIKNEKDDDVGDEDEAGDEEEGVEEDDVVEQELSSSRTPRLGKQYSYEDLRRKSIRMSPSETRKERSMSITKQFDEEVRNMFHQREGLLTSKEFEQIFGMTKKEFKALPKWRQQELKKRYK